MTTSKVAFLVAGEGIERVELTEPWAALEDAGYQPVLVSPAEDEVQLFDHLDKADTQKVDQAVASADLDDYAALVLPGGVITTTSCATTRRGSRLCGTFLPPASWSPPSATRRGR